jgi:hypothetical protein
MEIQYVVNETTAEAEWAASEKESGKVRWKCLRWGCGDGRTGERIAGERFREGECMFIVSPKTGGKRNAKSRRELR